MRDAMTRVPLEPRHYTVDEYFAIDEAAETRHEYVDGQIFDMAGGTDAHSQVTVNLLGLLWTRLRGKQCQARDGNLRVRYGRKARYGYPDAIIVCDKPEFDPRARSNTTLLNPAVLFEVLSESTEAYDRGKKFEYYRDIESLREYVLVAQERPSVRVYRRDPSGVWAIQPPYNGLDAVVRIVPADIELPLSELYTGVEFPPQEPEPGEAAD
jgi:Uma2 family endonuclease